MLYTNSLLSKLPGLLLVAGTLVLSGCESQVGLIHNAREFDEAVSNAQPGDVLTLANGTYSDLELRFTGRGSEEAPIRLAFKVWFTLMSACEAPSIVKFAVWAATDRASSCDAPEALMSSVVLSPFKVS